MSFWKSIREATVKFFSSQESLGGIHLSPSLHRVFMTQILGISQAGFYWFPPPASLNTWLRAFPCSRLVSFICFLGACLPDSPVTFGTTDHSLDETFRCVVFIRSPADDNPWYHGALWPLPQLCRHWCQWWWWILCVSFSLILSRPLWSGFRPPVIQSPNWRNKCLNFCESSTAAEVVTFFRQGTLRVKNNLN